MFIPYRVIQVRQKHKQRRTWTTTPIDLKSNKKNSRIKIKLDVNQIINTDQLFQNCKEQQLRVSNTLQSKYLDSTNILSTNRVDKSSARRQKNNNPSIYTSRSKCYTKPNGLFGQIKLQRNAQTTMGIHRVHQDNKHKNNGTSQLQQQNKFNKQPINQKKINNSVQITDIFTHRDRVISARMQRQKYMSSKISKKFSHMKMDMNIEDMDFMENSNRSAHLNNDEKSQNQQDTNKHKIRAELFKKNKKLSSTITSDMNQKFTFPRTQRQNCNINTKRNTMNGQNRNMLQKQAQIQKLERFVQIGQDIQKQTYKNPQISQQNYQQSSIHQNISKSSQLDRQPHTNTKKPKHSPHQKKLKTSISMQRRKYNKNYNCLTIKSYFDRDRHANQVHSSVESQDAIKNNLRNSIGAYNDKARYDDWQFYQNQFQKYLADIKQRREQAKNDSRGATHDTQPHENIVHKYSQKFITYYYQNNYNLNCNCSTYHTNSSNYYSPLMIRSLPNNFNEISEEQLRKMQEVYKIWKNKQKNKLIVSGLHIHKQQKTRNSSRLKSKNYSLGNQPSRQGSTQHRLKSKPCTTSMSIRNMNLFNKQENNDIRAWQNQSQQELIRNSIQNYQFN